MSGKDASESPGQPPDRQLGVGDLKISEAAKRMVSEVLDSNRLTYGPVSREFEREFAGLHGSNYGVLSNSGTSSLHVALLALKEVYGWADGDEVIVPAATFVASANSVLHAGLKPVFVDVDPGTFTMDPLKIPQSITDRTRCLMPVHLCGLTADMPAISEVAKHHGLRLVEDSCEAMFVGVAGRQVGGWGDIGCFSFYAAHLLVTGVGGMAICNDPTIAQLMRSLCNHGRSPLYVAMDDDLTESQRALEEVVESRFRFERVGYSYRITEIEAALGMAQLLERGEMLAARTIAARTLTQGLVDLVDDGLVALQVTPDWAEHAHMMFPIILDEALDVQKVVNEIEYARVETRPFFPMIAEPVLRNYAGPRPSVDYPTSTRLSRHGFYVGCHQGLGKQDLEYMVSVIQAAIRSEARRSC